MGNEPSQGVPFPTAGATGGAAAPPTATVESVTVHLLSSSFSCIQVPATDLANFDGSVGGGS